MRGGRQIGIDEGRPGWDAIPSFPAGDDNDTALHLLQ